MRTCMACKAEYAEADGTRFRCYACVGRAHNAINLASVRRRSAVVGSARRVVHRGEMACRRCGRSEAREWVTRKPIYCHACSGRLVTERVNHHSRLHYARKHKHSSTAQ